MKPTGSRRLAALVAVVGTFCAAAPALAHPGHPGPGTLGVWAGLAHPLSGLDHLLAMTAVGLWAALRGGRALAVWPATFLAAMAVGFAAPGLDPSLTEAGVVGSLVVLGLMTALNLRAPQGVSLVLLAVAGCLHGMAHATDIGVPSLGFEAGMLATTALLHLAGLALGLRLHKVGRADLVRLLGAGVAACGFVMAAAA
jgi:urease accessory protein